MERQRVDCDGHMKCHMVPKIPFCVVHTLCDALSLMMGLNFEYGI